MNIDELILIELKDKFNFLSIITSSIEKHIDDDIPFVLHINRDHIIGFLVIGIKNCKIFLSSFYLKIYKEFDLHNPLSLDLVFNYAKETIYGTPFKY